MIEGFLLGAGIAVILTAIIIACDLKRLAKLAKEAAEEQTKAESAIQ